MNLKRQFLAVGALVFLAARLLAADTNVVPAAATAISPGVTREEATENNLRLQEQIHETQLAIEQNQKATMAAAQSNVVVLTARLESLEQSRAADAVAAHKAQQTTLLIAGIIGLAGLIIMLLMVYFQSRAFTQLTQISTQQYAALANASGIHQLAAPGRAAVETANTQLLGVIGRLEQRINELEGGQRLLPEMTSAKAADQSTGKNPDLLAEGQKHLEANSPLRALECFDQFISAHPDHAEALVKRAAALEKLGRDDEALAGYNNAIAADNTLVTAHLQKGGLLNRRHRYEEALSCYEQVLRLQEKKTG